MINRFEKIENDRFIEVFNESESKGEICRKLNLPDNGSSRRYINNMINDLNLDIQILKDNHYKKYYVKKTCVVCGKEFEVPNYYNHKVCCSYACSNTYFRSGENNGMYHKATKYTTLCFRHHQHKCCVCGEEKIVEVHHYDFNHTNNEPSNLVPLCPTHHQYIHSRYKNEIQHIVDDYVRKFKNENI